MRSSRRVWSSASQSLRSWARSNCMGSQMPSFFDFWKRRIGTESKSMPRREMLRYPERVAIRPQSWTSERLEHRPSARLLPVEPGLSRDGLRPGAAGASLLPAGVVDRAALLWDQLRHRVPRLGLRLERRSLPGLVPLRGLFGGRLAWDGDDLPALENRLRLFRRLHHLPRRAA